MCNCCSCPIRCHKGFCPFFDVSCKVCALSVVAFAHTIKKRVLRRVALPMRPLYAVVPVSKVAFHILHPRFCSTEDTASVA